MNKADIVWNCMNTCEYVQNEARASLRFLAGLTWQKFLSSMNAKNSHRMDSCTESSLTKLVDNLMCESAAVHIFTIFDLWGPMSQKALGHSFGPLANYN
jgi:hypothetical protein